jgi:hypothetical protein
MKGAAVQRLTAARPLATENMKGVRVMPQLRIAIIRQKYSVHKACAKRRGIAFELTFEEWLEIWEASGHFEERGTRSHQYHMARHGDLGPYAVGNVKIVTASQNAAEGKGSKGWKYPPRSAEHRKKLSEANTGNKPSAETLLKLSAIRKGKKLNLSPEERLRRSVAITTLNSLSDHRAKQVAARWPRGR